MNIHIRTIAHHEQRYDTVGDYFTDAEDTRQFLISKLGNPDYEFLVALHELIESHLSEKRGIWDETIDAFDRHFEEARRIGLVPEDAEPGDDPHAPYRSEHQFATLIERWMARELGVDWEEYSKSVRSVGTDRNAHLGARR